MLVWAVLACSPSYGQNAPQTFDQYPAAYPNTPYQSFNSESKEAFAVSRPVQADSTGSQSDRDYRSMSPDSWENPQGSLDSRRTNPFAAQTGVQIQGAQVKGLQGQTATSKEWFSTPAKNADDLRANLPEKNSPFQSAGHPVRQPNPTAPGMSQTPSFPQDIRLPHSVPEKSTELESVILPDRANSREPGNGLNGTSKANPPSGYPLYSSPQTEGNLESLLENNQVTQKSPHLGLESSLPHSRVESEYSGHDQQSIVGPPNFGLDLGHRAPFGTQRDFGQDDYGQVFDFEKKKEEYPGLGEILKTGRYFGSASAAYVTPAFQANTAIFQSNSGITDTFDFSYKLAPQFQIGFESKFGPGVMFEYFGYDDLSRLSSFTSDGVESGTSSAWMRGANVWSRLTADGAGETLSARHRMNVDVIGVSFFKEIKVRKVRFNGSFGFQHAHIIHELQASLANGAGTEIGSLRGRSDVRGYGPKFKLEYFRPVGHTKIEFLVSTSGSVMFGDQSQVILNSTGGNQSRLEANEFIMSFDFFTGAQYRVMRGENRYFFAKAGMNYQAWLHGGTAVLPQDDFGLRGFVLTAGFNR